MLIRGLILISVPVLVGGPKENRIHMPNYPNTSY